VTAVDKAVKLDMLLAMGADRVINFLEEDFTWPSMRRGGPSRS
jgi:hypothetical protein